jgi:hypothetical protein
MSDIKQEVVFVGSGIDTDSDERWIRSGDGSRFNIMISGDEATGVITNILGNEQTIDISDHRLNLALTYTTIGSFYNRLTRKAYYLVFTQPYDSGGGVYIYDNRLFCYNEDQKTLDLIFIDTKNYLGADLNSPMRDWTMIGDWLYINPRVEEPKMIDVTRAYNYTNYSAYASANAYLYGDKVTYRGGLFLANTSVSTGQTPVTHPAKWDRIGDSYCNETDLAFGSEFYYAFNVLKSPPQSRPTTSYGSDANIQANNVRGKVFRFAYRYKYFDNTYSVYSAHSDITLPEDDEVYNGEVINDITSNNYIKVSVYPHSPALVKEVEVVAQEISETSGDWKRIKVINRQEQAQLNTYDFTFNFYNNESYVVEDNVDVARIIDYVPQRANSQEIINKNILCYGGCLEGFDNVPKDEIRVGLTPVLNAIESSSLPGSTLKDVYATTPYLITYVYDLTTTPATIGKRIDLGSWYPNGVVDGTQVITTIDGKTINHTFTAGENATKANYLTVMMNLLQDNYPTYRVVKSTDYITLWSAYGNSHFAGITQFLFCTVGVASSKLSKKRGFKTGANHPFCIFYYDESMRRWDAQVSKDNIRITGLEMHGTTVYVPTFNEVSPVPDNLAYRWTIDWEVYHLPPEGAKYWRWGYAGNSLCSYMVQYIIKSIADEAPDQCMIDITPLQTLQSTTTATWNQYPMSVIAPYAWEKGDRIRFITQASAPQPGTTVDTIIDGVYEYEIIKQDTADTYKIYVQHFDFGAVSIGENTLVEIYRPLKSITDTKTLYYEFGELMNIKEDSAGILVHEGQGGLHNQDTALSHSAMGTFDGGDIYHITRTPSKPIDTSATTKGVFHESMWYSDFYTSDDYDRGKIGIETTFGQRFLNIVRYSRPYFQNTQLNGLSTFEEDLANNWPGFKELNDVFGYIVAIYEQGDTLKVYQERKACSILIGRTEYLDSTGNSTVATSNAVLGTVRYSPSNFSTVFPESIARNNKVLYGFDIYNGVAWRDGVNGLFPISGRYSEAGGDVDYRMQTYFKLKSKALMESGIGHVDVLGVWDEEYKCYYLTFKDYVIETNNETIVFHEPSNRWITFVDFNQTPANGYNVPLELTYDIVRGFEGGIGYSFNKETRFAKFDIGGGKGTPANVMAFPPLLTLKYIIYDPVASVLETPVATDGTSPSISGFTANWNVAIGAVGYFLDVATDAGFTSMVAGYNDKNVGNVLTSAVTGLDGRTAYYYRVRAIDSYSLTSVSSNVITVDIVLPAPVANDPDPTTVSGTGFTARWSAVTGVSGYYLDVSTNSAFSSFVAGYNNKDVGNVVSSVVSGLTTNTTYFYKVRAYNAFQTSVSSNWIDQRTSSPPSNPVILGATNRTTNGFTANWQASALANGYYLDVSTDPTFATFVTGFQVRDVGNVTSFVVVGLSDDTLYYYRVRAYNLHYLVSGYSDVASVKTLMTPPTAISATSPYSEGFIANWYAKTGATGYYLDISTNISFNTFVTGYNNKDVGNVTHYDVTGLTQAVTYYYRLRAYAADQTTGNSNVITQPTGLAPSVPAAQPANPILSDGFTANWFGSTNSTGYSLDVASDIGFGSIIGTYSQLGLSQAVTGLTPLTTYYYRVRSHDDYGIYSAYSSTITVTTKGLVPNVPVATTVSGVGTNGFTANWNASGGAYPATGYKLFISQDPGFSSYESGYNGKDVGNVTTYAVTGLLPDHGYFYKLSAYNGAGESSTGNVITAYTNPLPLPTIGLSPSTWNFGGININKVITVTITNATSWGINFPSQYGRIHEYTRDATTSTLYYSGAQNTGDTVQFYATGAGGTTTVTFQGRWI